jgi:hypothetical protein
LDAANLELQGGADGLALLEAEAPSCILQIWGCSVGPIAYCECCLLRILQLQPRNGVLNSVRAERAVEGKEALTALWPWAASAGGVGRRICVG